MHLPALSGLFRVSRVAARIVGVALALLLAIPRPGLARGPELRAVDAADALGALAAPPEVPAGWMHLDGPHLHVVAHPDDQGVARRLLQRGEAALPRLANALGVGAGGDITVYIAPDDATFEAMQPGPTPPWADGLAWPGRGLIYLHAPRARIGTDEPVEVVLEHELVHILLGRAFAPRPVPSWLQEGAAQVLAGQLRLEQTDDLALGLLGGSAVPLSELTRGFPADPARARVAYAESALFVAYLRQAAGADGLRALIGRMARGESVDEAIVAVTGKGLAAHEGAWRAEVESSPLWLKPLFSEQTLLAVGALGFVLGGGAALRRRRTRHLQRLPPTDGLHDALIDAVAEWPGRPPLPRRREGGSAASRASLGWPHPVPGAA